MLRERGREGGYKISHSKDQHTHTLSLTFQRSSVLMGLFQEAQKKSASRLGVKRLLTEQLRRRRSSNAGTAVVTLPGNGEEFSLLQLLRGTFFL